MAPDVTSVRYIQGYRLELGFADGRHAEVDLKPYVFDKGGVFKALEDVAFFARVWVNEEIGTIVWPNHADLSPEFLYGLATGNAARLIAG